GHSIKGSNTLGSMAWVDSPQIVHSGIKEWVSGDPRGGLGGSFPPSKVYGMFIEVTNSFSHLIPISADMYMPIKEFQDHHDDCIRYNSPELMRARTKKEFLHEGLRITIDGAAGLDIRTAKGRTFERDFSPMKAQGHG
ncbi:hypothetical protein KI387_018518, partial [Taxus chinensis]